MGSQPSSPSNSPKRVTLQPQIKEKTIPQEVHEFTLQLQIKQKIIPQYVHELTIAEDNEKISYESDTYHQHSQSSFDKSSQKAKSQNDGYIRFTGPLKIKEIQAKIQKINQQLKELKENKTNSQMEQKILLQKYQQISKETKRRWQQCRYQLKRTRNISDFRRINLSAIWWIDQEQIRLKYKFIMKCSDRNKHVNQLCKMLQQQFYFAEISHNKYIDQIHEYFEQKINQIYDKEIAKQMHQKNKEDLEQQKYSAMIKIQQAKMIHFQFNMKIPCKKEKLLSTQEQMSLRQKQKQLKLLQNKQSLKQEEKDLTNLQINAIKETIKKLRDINQHKINRVIKETGLLSQRIIKYLQQYQQLIKLVLQRKEEHSDSVVSREVNEAQIELQSKIQKCNQHFRSEILKAKQKFNKDFLHLEQCYQKELSYQGKEEDFDFEQTRYFEKGQLSKYKCKQQQLEIAKENAKELSEKIKEECKRMQNKKEQAYEALQNYKKEKESQRAERSQQKRHLRDKLRVLQGQRLSLLKSKPSEAQQNTPKKTSPNLLKQITKPKLKYRFNQHFNDFYWDTDKRHSFSVPPRLKYPSQLKQQKDVSLNQFCIEEGISEEKHRSREQIVQQIAIVNLKLRHMQKQRQQILNIQRYLEKTIENTKTQMAKIKKEKEDSNLLKNKIKQKQKLILAIKNQQNRLQSNKPMTHSEKWQIQGKIYQQTEQNIQCIRDKWNRLIKTSRLLYQKNIKEINEDFKYKIQELQNILINKHFEDDNLELFVKFEKRLQRLEKQISQNQQIQMQQRELQTYQKQLKTYIQRVASEIQQKKKIEQFQQNMKLEVEGERKEYYRKMDRLYQSYQQEDPSKSGFYDEKDLQNLEDRHKQCQKQFLQEYQHCLSLNTRYYLLQIQLPVYQQEYKEISQKANKFELKRKELKQLQIVLWNQSRKVARFTTRLK